MQIIGNILYSVLLLITLGFGLGVRAKKDVVYPTVLMSFYFSVTALVFTFMDINKLHLAWIISVIYASTFTGLNVKIFSHQTPFISNILRDIMDSYAAVVRLGSKK